MTDTETVRKLFDDLAGDYDKHVPFFETFGRRLVDWCGLRPGQRVLDIAAGRGAVTAPAALAVGPHGADDRWDFYRELMMDMAGRVDEATSPDPFTPPPRPLAEICTEAGFTAIEQRTVRASFAIRDPQHYWAWIMSHGIRGYIDSLGPRLAAEFQARMLAGLERVHASGGITLDGTVSFTRARKA